MNVKISMLLVLLLCCINYAHTQSNLPADFPEYQNTGNKKTDNANYDKAKKAWVESKPEAYKKMGGQVNTADSKINNEPVDSIVIEDESCLTDKKDIPVVPKNCKIWQLVETDVIDKEQQLKSTELSTLKTEIREEFLSKTIRWKMSPEGILYIFYNDEYTGHFQFEKDNKQLTLLPYKETACSNGAKFFPFEKWDDEQIIINMPDDDEGSSLVYQLIFAPAR